jgi:hypothetical protein
MLRILTTLGLLLALSANLLAADVVLAWDPNSESDLAGYNVFQANAAGGPYAKIGSTGVLAAPTYTVSGLLPGTYFWVVTAFNTAGQESGYSNEVSKVITGPPQPPAGLKITSQSASLRWFGVVLLATTSEPAAATFRYQKIGTNGWSTVIATPTPTKTEHRVVLYLPKVVDYFKYEWTVTSAGGTATGIGTFETR